MWVRIRIAALVLGQLASAAPRTSRTDLERLGRSGRRFVDSAASVWERVSLDGPLHVEARAWRARVEAEDARLRWLTGVEPPSGDALVAAWRAAVTRFAEFGHVFELARSQVRLAAALRAVGEASEARGLASAAGTTARRLGAQPLAAEVRAVAGPGADLEQGRGERADAGAELTPREHEILALVAQGLTNAQIGRRLFISSKTVSVHVSHLMAKLGAGGRTEAVALARRASLLMD